MEIGEYHLQVELMVDRIIEEGHNMLTIIEMTFGEEILEKHKIIEVDIEETTEMKTLEG